MRHRRKTAVLMAAVTLSMSVASPVRAAAPRVQVDETMYVNMDYYGNMTTVNVVKGCSTNGVERYTDYGVYDKVVNMTDKTEPELGDGSVTWQLPEGSKRFYYQCTMPDGTTELPWTFDISYKLNGVEADASKLSVWTPLAPSSSRWEIIPWLCLPPFRVKTGTIQCVSAPMIMRVWGLS